MRVISRFDLEVSSTPEEYLRKLFSNFLFDLSLINKQRHIRVSQVIQYKGAILTVKLEEVNRLIESYNKTLLNFWEDYKDIWKRWHSSEIKEALKTVIKEFREKFNKDYALLVDKAEKLIYDLRLLRAMYILQKTENTTLTKIEKKLGKMSEISYEKFIESIKKGNLPLI